MFSSSSCRWLLGFTSGLFTGLCTGTWTRAGVAWGLAHTGGDGGGFWKTFIGLLLMEDVGARRGSRQWVLALTQWRGRRKTCGLVTWEGKEREQREICFDSFYLFIWLSIVGCEQELFLLASVNIFVVEICTQVLGFMKHREGEKRVARGKKRELVLLIFLFLFGWLRCDWRDDKIEMGIRFEEWT